MARRPRWSTTTTLLLRKRLRLARAHYVLRYIDQVSFPVFFHRSTKLLRGASLRCILVRTVDLPTYVGADYRAFTLVVVHKLFASVVFHSYKVFSFIVLICIILVVLTDCLCVLEAPVLSACANVISLVRLSTWHGDWRLQATKGICCVQVHITWGICCTLRATIAPLRLASLFLLEKAHSYRGVWLGTCLTTNCWDWPLKFIEAATCEVALLGPANDLACRSKLICDTKATFWTNWCTVLHWRTHQGAILVLTGRALLHIAVEGSFSIRINCCILAHIILCKALIVPALMETTRSCWHRCSHLLASLVVRSWWSSCLSSRKVSVLSAIWTANALRRSAYKLAALIVRERLGSHIYRILLLIVAPRRWRIDSKTVVVCDLRRWLIRVWHSFGLQWSNGYFFNSIDWLLSRLNQIFYASIFANFWSFALKACLKVHCFDFIQFQLYYLTSFVKKW